MTYDKKQWLAYIDQLLACRDKILSLYKDTLYEDNWDKTTEMQFDSLLKEYNLIVEKMQSMLPYVEWTNEKSKNVFMKTFNQVILDDQESYNLVQLRHEMYMVYRTNRKSIILQLNEVTGMVKNQGKKKYKEILQYFNNKCAKIPLYNKEENEPTYTKHSVLGYWFASNRIYGTDEINHSVEIEGKYTQEECTAVFNKYVALRFKAYKIFNMLTSKSPVNGYKKWHNYLDAYCEGDITNPQLEKLYNAANTENYFVPVDDYHLTSDERSWMQKGIFESWFDDDLDNYLNKRNKKEYNKKDIVKIDLKSDKALMCKIVMYDEHVYAGTKFYKNDIVEICPTRTIDRLSLYAKDIRDLLFEVKENEEYVLPFGYCQYYDIAEANQPANCGFLWDPITRNIIIKALRKIDKGEKLILQIVN